MEQVARGGEFGKEKPKVPWMDRQGDAARFQGGGKGLPGEWTLNLSWRRTVRSGQGRAGPDKEPGEAGESPGTAGGRGGSQVESKGWAPGSVGPPDFGGWDASPVRLFQVLAKCSLQVQNDRPQGMFPGEIKHVIYQ